MSENAKIIKVKKNQDGDITDVMTSGGNVYSVNEAIMMARDGKLEGVNVGRAKNGSEYLRSDPNNSEKDNLNNLPVF